MLGLSVRYETSILNERIGTLDLRLHCISNFEAAIDAMFAELEAVGSPELLEELCPYFGTLWPAGRLLAKWVWEQPAWTGQRVLELGCGLALPSLVASARGALVTASDLHPDVPDFLERNLRENPGLRVRYRRLDWRAAQTDSDERYDWILGSDVLYERDQPSSILRFLETALALGGKAILVDPNRSYWQGLVDAARAAGLDVDVSHLSATVPPNSPQAVLVKIRLSNRF